MREEWRNKKINKEVTDTEQRHDKAIDDENNNNKYDDSGLRVIKLTSAPHLALNGCR